MGIVFADHSMSLDGFSTGPNVRVGNEMGDGGEALHEWMFQEGGKSGHRGEVLEDLFGNTGAVVVGRRMFDLGERLWGDNPPFHRPVFVVTHRAKEQVTKQGGTAYTFVTEGLEATLAQARSVAGERDVAVLGGPTLVQQCLRAGLLSELRLHVVHLLLGDGNSLFKGVNPATFALERVRLIDAAGVSHFTFNVRAPK
jgi:dihydrofolate reductase